jgi:hypothetical protein
MDSQSQYPPMQQPPAQMPPPPQQQPPAPLSQPPHQQQPPPPAAPTQTTIQQERDANAMSEESLRLREVLALETIAKTLQQLSARASGGIL